MTTAPAPQGSVDGSKIPRDAAVAVYTSSPWWLILCVFSSQQGAFLGCFFGIGQPDDWPSAWWAFALIQFWPLFVIPKKLKRTANGYVTYNLGNGKLWCVSFDQIASLSVDKQCGCRCVKITMTDEAYEKCRAEACSKYCVFKSSKISLWRSDFEAFSSENGFDSAV